MSLTDPQTTLVVQAGTDSQAQIASITYPYWWPQQQYQQYPCYIASPNLQRFRGEVSTMSKLPNPGYRVEDAQLGDAYYVRDLKILVIRQSNGWHVLDGKTSD